MAPTANAHMSSPKLGEGSIATPWEQLQGSCSWEGLLEPLNADLRASLIAYGELAEAAYDGFDADGNSPHAGSCIYGQAGLLAASGVSHPEYYTITKFLNATWEPLLGQSPESMAIGNALFVQQPEKPGRSERRTNWIGYVAVATDEGAKALGRRDIVVAWRGTVQASEKWKDFYYWYASVAEGLHLPAEDKYVDANVHGGFLSVYTTKNPRQNYRKSQIDIVIGTSARDEAIREVQDLVVMYKSEETSITVTGHSLGASLATLNAFDIVAHGINVPPASSKHIPTHPCPVTVILFASPRVGDDNFRSVFSSFPDLRALHVKNQNDIVTSVPTGNFSDAATATLLIDTNRSPYLRPGNRLTWLWNHNLQCYLHGIAGDHGAEKHFKLVVNRDMALVNKSTNRLKEEYPVPANWWVTANSYYKGKGVARFKLDYFEEK